jgi:hypothetical protein
MVKSDTKLCARYARHFGTTMTGVSDYFDDHLRLVRLKKSRTTNVYYVTSNGRMGRTRRILPAGTLVFVNEAGQPVLDWRCGNPLASALPRKLPIRSGLKSPSFKVGKSTPAGKVEVAAAPPDLAKVVEKVLAAPPAEFTSVQATTAVALPPVAASMPPIVEAATVPSVAAVGSPPVVAAASHGIASWILPALAATGGVVALRPGSGGASITPPTTEPVPEPGSLVVLATGVSTACAFMIKRRRRC